MNIYGDGTDKKIQDLGITNDLKVKKFNLYDKDTDKLMKQLGITNDLKVKYLLSDADDNTSKDSSSEDNDMLGLGGVISVDDMVKFGKYVDGLTDENKKSALATLLETRTKNEVDFIFSELNNYQFTESELTSLYALAKYSALKDDSRSKELFEKLDSYTSSHDTLSQDDNNINIDSILKTYSSVISENKSTENASSGVPSTDKDGWLKQSDGWHFKEKGSDRKSWLFNNGKWYFFDNNGLMKTGWLKDSDGKWYYLNDDGSMASNTTINGYSIGVDGKLV